MTTRSRVHDTLLNKIWNWSSFKGCGKELYQACMAQTWEVSWSIHSRMRVRITTPVDRKVCQYEF